MPELTQKEYAVFCFIRQFFEDFDKSPTRKEIGKAFSFTPQSADYFVHRLFKKKIISIHPKKARNIKILKKYLGRQPHLW